MLKKREEMVLQDGQLNRVRFIREGYLRDHTIIDGKKYSVEVWSMLRHEYTRFFNDEKRVKKLLLI